jgi:inner membrane protein
MDPLTHALLGGAAAYAATGHRLGRRSLLMGAVAALLPDADVFIRSAADPLLLIEHHRGFTHSLAFMPLGAAVAAAPWLTSGALRARGAWVYLAALAGYASHGPLDAATTYGTQLFWPLSSHRVGLDWVSIIDPAVTLVLALGVAVAMARSARPAALAALGLVGLYLLVGASQRLRALEAQESIAAARGHERVRRAAFPTFANQIVWRSYYQVGDTLHVDRVRVPWWGGAEWAAGFRVERLGEEALPPAVRGDPRTLRDFRRFAWFSDGWVARADDRADVVGDARYSLRNDRFHPIWGVRLSPGERPPTEWIDRTRERRLGVSSLLDEIRGRDPEYRPVGRETAPTRTPAP